MARLLFVLPVLLSVFLYWLHAYYFAGTFCDSPASLVGKTVIVTGANTGIGKTTALDLASRGARVILACRSEARAMPAVKEIREKTKNDQVIFMPLDLASFRSVRDFAASFIEKEGKLNILINNAGIIGTDDAKLSEDGIEMTMAINYFGPFLLTNLLVDVMKASGPGGRIVNLNSLLYNFANPAAFQDFEALKTDGTAGYPKENIDLQMLDDGTFSQLCRYLPAGIRDWLLSPFVGKSMIRYNNSKMADLLFTLELARRLAGTGITTYSPHPGVITTEIGMDRNTEKERTSSDFQGLIATVITAEFFRKSLEGGAQTTVCCAVDEKRANESGLYYSDCEPMEVRRPEYRDAALLAKFYDWSMEVTSLKTHQL